MGIDYHTAALHRTNLPQVRLAPDQPEMLEMAEAFAPPVILISKLREKSLRLAAGEAGVKVLSMRAVRRCASRRGRSTPRSRARSG